MVYNIDMNNTTNSRDTILQCALKLFGKKGYESVGITEITQQAGITKPTLYYFFQSKEGVFKAILEEYYVCFNRLLESVCTYALNTEFCFEDIYPVLARVVNTYFSFTQENEIFYLMLLSLSFAPPTAQTTIITKPYITRQYEIVIELFKNISVQHHNLIGKELECACHFVAMINANIGFWYQGHTKLDENKVRSIVQNFLHGVLHN